MSLSTHEVREALDEATVRGMQILQLALVVGVVLFTGFTIARAMFFPGPAETAAPPDESTLRMLSAVNVALLVAAFVLGNFLFRSRMASEDGDVVQRVATLRGATVLRLALLEGAALFGVATCFLATPSGPPADPSVWLNLVSPAVFVLFAVATFPDREKLTAVLTGRSV